VLRQFTLLRYALPHWRGVVIVLFVMALGIALDVLRPWPMKLLVDNVLGQQPLPAEIEGLLEALPGPGGREGLLLWVCVSTVVFFLGGTFLGLANGFTSVDFNRRMTYDLAADLFFRLQRLSLLFHSRRSVSDTITRVNKDPNCVQTLFGLLVGLLHAVIKLVTIFTIMWHLEPTLTLFSLGVVPFQILSIRVFGRPMKERTRDRRELEVRMLSVVQQALSAIPAVQAFTREELEHARFRAYATSLVAAYQRSTLIGMWFKLLLGLVTSVGTAGIMWLGAQSALEGKLTVGAILVFLAYLKALYQPLNSITTTVNSLQQTTVNADRVLEILDTPYDVPDRPNAQDIRVQGYVRYESVTFGYAPNRPALKEISFETSPEEVLAIVGPTGAGKTTLVSLLVRFFDPWSGRVTIDGWDLRDLQLHSLRQQVAIVLQEPFVFSVSVADNIAYGRPEATREEIAAAAVAANADDFIRRLPEGYDTVVGERGSTLSGGEKQRLSIARAFLKDAPILILDEPTSALDARTEALLLDALERLREGRTTFVIAHRLSTIRNANRILVLDQGQIVEQGRHWELMSAEGLYASLYRQQMDVARHEPLPAMAAKGTERSGR
jgi:ATP-binding cassette, subfamily B, bacterial